MAERAVEIRNLSYAYGDHQALRDVSLTIEQGALFGLLGPNGGGKTTLFRVLSTLIRPSQDVASVFGFDTSTQPGEVRQRLGVVFQHTALDGDLSVTENLTFHGALYGLSGSALRSRIEELLHLFGLSDRTRDRVKTLSGGFQRRTDLVRALLHHPPLLLLDEPTTGLDPAARHTFWQLLTEIRRAHGTTMIAATHLLDEAEQCDEVAIIHQGKIVASGAPGDLKDQLGSETLWIECDDPAGLRDRILDRFGISAQVVHRSLQINHPQAPTLLPELYEAFGTSIRSATVRKPTLEDVFMAKVGYRMDDQEAALDHADAQHVLTNG